ncbi:MAG: hypothetical protein P4L46_15035 [Fimbriimonas sp.]|nr:hypothetical protein [Fimbriimonas sp.]
MKRPLAPCAILILGVFCTGQASVRASHSNSVLVLMQPALAGPPVDPATYWHPTWILWPPMLDPSQGGRLLSLATGANWVGNTAFFQTTGFGEMKRRGFFEVRKSVLGDVHTDLLLNSKGGASNNALVLALNADSPKVKPYWMDEAWPASSLMVAEAPNWDEVRKIESATTGRVLVVEYPPRADVPWTRFWLRGNRWPSDGGPRRADYNSAYVPNLPNWPVPGLIPATQAVELVVRPERFPWTRADSHSWPGANRFLELGHGAGFLFQFVWMFLVAMIVIWGAVVVSNERTSRLLPHLFGLIVLSPAVVAAAGVLARALGFGEWQVWLFLSFLAALPIQFGLGEWQRRVAPRAHPLAFLCLFGIVVLAACNPVWGLMSPIFGGRVWSVSPVGLAALFGYLVGSVSFLQNCGPGWRWLGRTVCAIVWLLGISGWSWWSAEAGACLFFPFAAWMIGERFFRWWMLLPVSLWPPAVWHLWQTGFVWSPVGLLLDGRDRAGLNLYSYVEFAISGSLQIALPIAGGIALFGYRFFFRQIHNLLELDLRRRALPLAVPVAACFGLLHPIFLYGALTLGVGAASSLLFDAVQTM